MDNNNLRGAYFLFMNSQGRHDFQQAINVGMPKPQSMSDNTTEFPAGGTTDKAVRLAIETTISLT